MDMLSTTRWLGWNLGSLRVGVFFESEAIWMLALRSIPMGKYRVTGFGAIRLTAPILCHGRIRHPEEIGKHLIDLRESLGVPADTETVVAVNPKQVLLDGPRDARYMVAQIPKNVSRRIGRTLKVAGFNQFHLDPVPASLSRFLQYSPIPDTHIEGLGWRVHQQKGELAVAHTGHHRQEIRTWTNDGMYHPVNEKSVEKATLQVPVDGPWPALVGASLAGTSTHKNALTDRYHEHILG